MINRALIRTKVVQIVYSYLIDGDKSIDTAEKELFASLEKSYELYHLLLLIPVEVTHLQRLRIDNARSKFMATAEERTPNTRMIDNRFVAQLEENKTLSKSGLWCGTMIPIICVRCSTVFCRRRFMRSIWKQKTRTKMTVLSGRTSIAA